HRPPRWQHHLKPRTPPLSARCVRSDAPSHASKGPPRSTALSNTSTTCDFRACCTARFTAARSRTDVSCASILATRVANPYYGPAFHDQPILAIDKVRHVGEPVAVALATDPHVAEEAANLIEVEYEPLAAVFDEVAAARPDAPVVHDVLKPAGTFTDLKYLGG